MRGALPAGLCIAGPHGGGLTTRQGARTPPARLAGKGRAGDGTRDVALDLLARCLDARAALDDLWARHEGLNRLSGRDRAFARLLVATALRRLGQLDAILDTLMDRPLPLRGHVVRHVLRLALVQIVFTGTPAHAAVDAAVAQTRRRRHTSLTGLVNAVLRRASREAGSLVARFPPARHNAPAWLRRRWQDRYGAAGLARMIGAHMAVPPLDLTVRGDAAVWASRLDARVLPGGTIRRAAAGNLTALPGYDAGMWWVQDVAASVPARLLGPLAGQTVLDLCAAPGGKTAQLAAAGARVTAVDQSESRLGRLRANLRRLRLTAETVRADAASFRPGQPVPRILLDAPCSATGAIRRHPDIPWTREEGDIARAARRQKILLHAALDMLQPGGWLVYAVCSLEAAEGPDLVREVLAERPGVRRLPVTARDVSGLGTVSPEGDWLTRPDAIEGGMDGFFVARLTRT